MMPAAMQTYCGFSWLNTDQLVFDGDTALDRATKRCSMSSPRTVPAGVWGSSLGLAPFRRLRATAQHLPADIVPANASRRRARWLSRSGVGAKHRSFPGDGLRTRTGGFRLAFVASGPLLGSGTFALNRWNTRRNRSAVALRSCVMRWSLPFRSSVPGSAQIRNRPNSSCSRNFAGIA
jgi:hypothetical protein